MNKDAFAKAQKHVNSYTSLNLTDEDWGPSQLSTERYQYQQLFQSVFGGEVYFFKQKFTPSIDGISVPGIGIFINEDTQKPVQSVFGHELLHHIKESRPDLYYDFLDVLNPTKEVLQEYRETLSARGIFDYSSTEMVTEEFVADFVGQQFDSQEFWSDLTSENPKLSKSFHREGSEFFEQTYGRAKEQLLPDHIYNQILNLKAAIGAAKKMILAYQADPAVSKDLFKKVALAGLSMEQKGGPKFLFAGGRAKNAPYDKIEKAKEFKRGGLSDEEILWKTGVHFGQDGKPRFEINDKVSFFYRRDEIMQSYTDCKQTILAINDEVVRGLTSERDALKKLEGVEIDIMAYISILEESDKSPPGTLGSCFYHPELFNHYPALRSAKVHFPDNMPITRQGRTTYSPNTESFTFEFNLYALENETGSFYDSVSEVMIHEVQHAIQSLEGFSQGGTPDELLLLAAQSLEHEAVEKLFRLKHAYESAPNFEKQSRLENYEKAYRSYRAKSFLTEENVREKSRQIYENLHGEIEARDASKRKHFSSMDRRKIQPAVAHKDSGRYMKNKGFIAAKDSNGSVTALRKLPDKTPGKPLSVETLSESIRSAANERNGRGKTDRLLIDEIMRDNKLSHCFSISADAGAILQEKIDNSEQTTICVKDIFKPNLVTEQIPDVQISLINSDKGSVRFSLGGVEINSVNSENILNHVCQSVCDLMKLNQNNLVNSVEVSKQPEVFFHGMGKVGESLQQRLRELKENFTEDLEKDHASDRKNEKPNLSKIRRPK